MTHESMTMERSMTYTKMEFLVILMALQKGAKGFER